MDVNTRRREYVPREGSVEPSRSAIRVMLVDDHRQRAWDSKSSSTPTGHAWRWRQGDELRHRHELGRADVARLVVLDLDLGGENAWKSSRVLVSGGGTRVARLDRMRDSKTREQ